MFTLYSCAGFGFFPTTFPHLTSYYLYYIDKPPSTETMIKLLCFADTTAMVLELMKQAPLSGFKTTGSESSLNTKRRDFVPPTIESTRSVLLTSSKISLSHFVTN
jgi:hypothetical protein